MICRPGTHESWGSGLVLVTLLPAPAELSRALVSRKATTLVAMALSMIDEITSETPRLILR